MVGIVIFMVAKLIEVSMFTQNTKYQEMMKFCHYGKITAGKNVPLATISFAEKLRLSPQDWRCRKGAPRLGTPGLPSPPECRGRKSSNAAKASVEI
jgi:hypothetical protein